MAWTQLRRTATALQSTAVDTTAAGQLLPPGHQYGIGLDIFGWTALHYAAAAGINSLVQRALDAGFAVNCRGYQNATPLLCAVRHGCVAVMEQLIDQGADVNARWRRRRCRTALHEAAAQGHLAATELLLARGAAVDAVDYEGMTPLHDAAAYGTECTANTGHMAVVELLLEHGAVIDAADELGRTPLHLAASNGKTEVVKLLLHKGAAVHAQDHDGNTPLSCAVELAVDGDGDDMKLNVFNVILQAGHPWPTADLVAAARVAVWRDSLDLEQFSDVQPNWTAFAVLAKATLLADQSAFDELLEELDLQDEDSAVMTDDVVRAIIKEWCSDVASLDQQRAELLEQRRDVEAQRRAVQHMIVSGACFMKHVVESTDSAHYGPQQQPDSGLLLPLGPMALACRP